MNGPSQCERSPLERLLPDEAHRQRMLDAMQGVIATLDHAHPKNERGELVNGTLAERVGRMAGMGDDERRELGESLEQLGIRASLVRDVLTGEGIILWRKQFWENNLARLLQDLMCMKHDVIDSLCTRLQSHGGDAQPVFDLQRHFDLMQNLLSELPGFRLYNEEQMLFSNGRWQIGEHSTGRVMQRHLLPSRECDGLEAARFSAEQAIEQNPMPEGSEFRHWGRLGRIAPAVHWLMQDIARLTSGMQYDEHGRSHPQSFGDFLCAWTGAPRNPGWSLSNANLALTQMNSSASTIAQWPLTQPSSQYEWEQAIRSILDKTTLLADLRYHSIVEGDRRRQAGEDVRLPPRLEMLFELCDEVELLTEYAYRGGVCSPATRRSSRRD